VDIPETLICTLEDKDLPLTWKAIPAPKATKEIGDKWFDERISAVLKVPSTVAPIQWNFVLNPTHPDFNKLKRGGIRVLELDDRLYL
jgi:RES domain-containing protein